MKRDSIYKYRKKLTSVSVILMLAASLPFIDFSLCSAQENRESWQPPEKIMDAIGVKSGMTIGEAGAGRGYFTFPLAHRVADKGIVYANDIWLPGLETIKNRAEREGIGNIKTVEGQADDPMFPVMNLDMSIMVYVLHEIKLQVPFLTNLKKYLKKDGMLVIIERNVNEDKSHIPSFLNSSQVLELARESGYDHIRTETFLPYDNIYIFRKKI